MLKGTFPDKILKDKAYEINLTQNMISEYGVQLGAIATSEIGASVNEVLVQELHKQVIKKFKRRKVYARFKDNRFS